jgi:phosphomevalonate kinase
MPPDLRVRCVWTGKSASTGDFLARLEARRERDPKTVDAAIDDLARISDYGVEALGTGRSGDFVAAVDEFCGALDALGDVIGMPVFSLEHRRLEDLAHQAGVHYKPSGAGGGDFGLAFAVGDESFHEFSDSVESAGFKVTEIVVDKNGAVAAPSLSVSRGNLI